MMLYVHFGAKPFKIMQKQEVFRILMLPGTTAAELLKMIEFHSYVGDFEKADEYSKKLVDIS